MRADAERNHDRIISAAVEVFSERGMDASLDEIAARAGVGPGTLYRHFPTREDLVDAVIKSWMEQIQELAEKAAVSELAPRELLIDWFATLVARISRNKGSPTKFITAMGNAESPIYSKCEVLRIANDQVLDRLRRDGALRSGVSSLEVCRLVGAVAVVADSSNLNSDSVTSMLTVVVDGLLA
jgi:AcrR family transcriptional regulator